MTNQISTQNPLIPIGVHPCSSAVPTPGCGCLLAVDRTVCPSCAARDRAAGTLQDLQLAIPVVAATLRDPASTTETVRIAAGILSGALRQAINRLEVL